MLGAFNVRFTEGRGPLYKYLDLEAKIVLQWKELGITYIHTIPCKKFSSPKQTVSYARKDPWRRKYTLGKAEIVQ
jgi:copper oxidase (laccase) domain-containing protein